MTTTTTVSVDPAAELAAELDALAEQIGPPIEPDTPPRKSHQRKPGNPPGPPRPGAQGSRGGGAKRIRAPRPGTSNAAIVKRAIDELDLLYALLGAGIRLVDAPAGSEIIARSSDLAGSWSTVLETNKQLRDWFAASERYSAWLPVIAAHAQLAGAIVLAHAAARQGQMPPAAPVTVPGPVWEPAGWPEPQDAGTGE